MKLSIIQESNNDIFPDDITDTESSHTNSGNAASNIISAIVESNKPDISDIIANNDISKFINIYRIANNITAEQHECIAKKIIKSITTIDYLNLNKMELTSLIPLLSYSYQNASKQDMKCVANKIVDVIVTIDDIHKCDNDMTDELKAHLVYILHYADEYRQNLVIDKVADVIDSIQDISAIEFVKNNKDKFYDITINALSKATRQCSIIKAKKDFSNIVQQISRKLQFFSRYLLLEVIGVFLLSEIFVSFVGYRTPGINMKNGIGHSLASLFKFWNNGTSLLSSTQNTITTSRGINIIQIELPMLVMELSTLALTKLILTKLSSKKLSKAKNNHTTAATITAAIIPLIITCAIPLLKLYFGGFFLPFIITQCFCAIVNQIEIQSLGKAPNKAPNKAPDIKYQSTLNQEQPDYFQKNK